MSDYFIPTLKETPSDAELASHRFMLRAGLIRRISSGIYTWMPLGLRVLRKVEAIIRKHMESVGALELLMPMVQPAELWQESGRWEQYGAELLRFEDRHQHTSCLGPTHEEVITDLLRKNVVSYKQLPLTLFQIQTKFRDEIRPRFGVMRAREFLMKDAYSFHVSKESLSDTYDKMYNAYHNIFTELGLEFKAVLADSGSIGGDLSHEFQVLASAGEDLLVYSDASDYAANIEQATSLEPNSAQLDTAQSQALSQRQLIDTKAINKFTELYKALDCNASQVIKTVIVKGDDVPWVALHLRADHEICPQKVQKLPHVASPMVALEKKNTQDLPCDLINCGPGLQMPEYADRDVAVMQSFICGANDNGCHWRDCVWGRDVSCPEIADLRQVVAGDLSPDGKGSLHFKRGIEVGHIFQLGTKYSKQLGAKVLDESGKSALIEAGCYGIGVSRIVAAAIEQSHDEQGIIWPAAMAPFQVHLLPLMAHKSFRVREAAADIYQQLTAAGVEVLWDDAKERPGVMFARSDLLGIPHRLIISERGLDQDTVEYKLRSAADPETWAISECVSKLISLNLL